MDFGSLAGAVLPDLAGGVVGALMQKKQNQQSIKAAKRAAKKDFMRTRKIRAEDRGWYLEDRSNERRYAAELLAQDRLYAEKMTGKSNAEARAYAEAQRGLAEARYKTDRGEMQALADKQAERAALSRGIDFAKLRDDAVAAGFNPLSALGFAQSYTRDVGYGVVGDIYNGGGEYGAAVAGGGGAALPMSGGGAAPGGQFATAGVGYTGTQLPPLMSSAGFIAEAVSRGVDNWINTPPPEDVEARQVMQQVIAGQLARQAAASTPRPLGYAPRQIRPFAPAVSHGSGALSAPLGQREPASGTPEYSEFHRRDVERMPMPDVPVVAYADVGGGRRVPIPNPDLDNELLNWAWGGPAAGLGLAGSLAIDAYENREFEREARESAYAHSRGRARLAPMHTYPRDPMPALPDLPVYARTGRTIHTPPLRFGMMGGMR